MLPQAIQHIRSGNAINANKLHTAADSFSVLPGLLITVTVALSNIAVTFTNIMLREGRTWHSASVTRVLLSHNGGKGLGLENPKQKP